MGVSIAKCNSSFFERPYVLDRIFGQDSPSLAVLFQQEEEILFQAQEASERHFVVIRPSGVECWH